MSRQALDEAKYPASAIAGPYGHPFHPIAVTIPIGTWVASLVFDVVGVATGDQAVFGTASRILILIGIVGAVIAAVLGLVDYSRIPKGTPARRTALTHMLLNLAGLVVWTMGLLVRAADPDGIPALGVALSVVALAALGLSGWLGGKLAYRYGVRVASEETQAEGYVRPVDPGTPAPLRTGP